MINKKVFEVVGDLVYRGKEYYEDLSILEQNKIAALIFKQYEEAIQQEAFEDLGKPELSLLQTAMYTNSIELKNALANVLIENLFNAVRKMVRRDAEDIFYEQRIQQDEQELAKFEAFEIECELNERFIHYTKGA